MQCFHDFFFWIRNIKIIVNWLGRFFFCELQKIFDHIVTLRRRTLNETLIFFCQMKFPINLVIAPNVVRFIANTTLPRHFLPIISKHLYSIFIFKMLSKKPDLQSTFFGKNRNLFNFSLKLFKQKFVLSHYDVKHTKH